jgi:hypothetical protein
MDLMQRLLRRLALTALLLPFLPAPAHAQTAGAAPSWLVGGLGGVTFGTVSSGAFGAQAGVRISRDLFVIAEGGRMQNALPKSARDEFDSNLSALEHELGVPITVTFTVPANYVFAGLRWAPSTAAVAPFVEGGIGLAHLSFKIHEATVLGIDIKKDLEDELDTSEASGTNGLIAFGGGITVRLSPAALLDAGYRFTRIATEDPTVNSSMLYVAIKYVR